MSTGNDEDGIFWGNRMEEVRAGITGCGGVVVECLMVDA
jgi:hypothetical protein